MRTPVTRIERATGLFLLIVTMLGVLAVVGAGRRSEIVEVFRAGFVISAVTESAYGAAVGSPVKVHDVEIGSVTSVRLVDDPAHPGKPVRITMRLRSSAAKFLKDKTVAVVVEPPLGSGMPPFGTSSVLLRSAGDRPLLAGAVVQAEAQESMVATFAKMSRDVSEMRGQMNAAIGEMGSTFVNLRKLTDALAHGQGLAGRMMTEAQLADDLEGMLKEARAASIDARRAFSETERLTKEMSGFTKDARAATQQGVKVFTRVDHALDDVPKLLATTERTMALAEQLVIELRQATRTAPELARKVDVSVEEATRLVEAAQRNFLLRGALPERVTPRTETVVRPPMPPASGAP